MRVFVVNLFSLLTMKQTSGRAWLMRLFRRAPPTPAVTAIASAPQNVTRVAPTVTPAPPVCAANPPRSARNANEVPATKGIRVGAGAIAATKSGIAAPIAKLPADANAA